MVALRAVETIDFMTARWAHLPYEFLEKVSNRIINEISGISRVVYDISSKTTCHDWWGVGSLQRAIDNSGQWLCLFLNLRFKW